MRNLVKFIQAAMLVMFSFTANAATTDVTGDAWQWLSKTSTFADTGFVAQAWHIDSNISGTTASEIEASLAAAGIILDLTDVYKNDAPVTGSDGELTVEGTSFKVSGTGIEGTILKAGTDSLVALFSETVESFYYNNLWSTNRKGTPKDLSHYVFLSGDGLPTDTTTPVPVPAAAFLFAPALVGLMGFRRKLR